MDSYPVDYVIHNLPLLLLSGLGEEAQDTSTGDAYRNLLQEGGFRLKTDLPAVTGTKAQELLQTLLSYDSTQLPWNAKNVAQLSYKACFRVRNIGRAFTLPPRKAPPPPHSPRLKPAAGSSSPPPPMILHSVLSPLTPSSPLYADGIMTPLWIAKHQSRLPSVFISFFSLSSDPNTDTLLDNKIKTEMSNIRNVFVSASYKTKIVFVLLGETEIAPSELEERVNNIRRAANFDQKSVYSLPGDASLPHIRDLVKDMLTALYPISVEYYRDLSKHARRKRSRNIVPQPTVSPPSGTSQPLSLQAWHVRYEYKLAILAEFRQEMDAACRNYETAYEALFGPDVFETIQSWSPRFNEARLLSDTIAIRIIRCLLWNGQTTSAAKWWLMHRNRTQDIVTRRGAGTNTYGWESWQSLWARTMADLISRAQVLPYPDSERSESVEKSVLIHSEKTLASTDRFSPWESLHHEGYWLYLAQQYTQARRHRALQMPEEDRVPPGQSPASTIASKAHLYDKYLTLEPYQEFPITGSPGYDYSGEIVRSLDLAVQNFSKHQQPGMVQMLQLKKALELMRSSAWPEAIAILFSLWQDSDLRRKGWWLLLLEVSRALWLSAVEQKDLAVLLQVNSELNHALLSDRSDVVLDLTATLNQLGPIEPERVALISKERLLRISPKFAFASVDGHVSESISAQLSLHHLALPRGSNLRLSHVKVVFEGGLKPIYLLDSTDDENNDMSTEFEDALLLDLPLSESPLAKQSTRKRSSMGAVEAWSAEADLLLRSGQIKIFQLQITPQEAGDVSVASITLSFEHGQHETTITAAHEDLASATWWESRQKKAKARLYGMGRDTASTKILPKPPKLEIQVPLLSKSYYTDEEIEIPIVFTNLEDESVTGSIEVKLVSPYKSGVTMKWKGLDEVASKSAASETTDFMQHLSSKTLNNLSVNGKTTETVLINSTDEAIDHELEVSVSYTSHSNQYTVLRRMLTVELPIVRPFEAKFGFHSRHHPEPWPCFFSIDSITRDSSNEAGLKQQYQVSALVCSFATDDLMIHSAQLKTTKILGDAMCSTSEETLEGKDTTSQKVIMVTEQTKQFNFNMTLQKNTLGDRQPLAVDFVLQLCWSRAPTVTSASSPEPETQKLHTSLLPIPRFLAPSSEPRVLLQVSSSISSESSYGVCQLIYIIENPSLHFLTFNLTMESSDDFAFSGPKAKSVSLVPISRHDVNYNIIPSGWNPKSRDNSGGNSSGKDEEGHEWMKVHLEVVDAYFGQTLRVQPASDRVKVDKHGNLLVKIR